MIKHLISLKTQERRHFFPSIPLRGPHSAQDRWSRLKKTGAYWNLLIRLQWGSVWIQFRAKKHGLFLLKLRIPFKEIADQIKHELQAIEQKIKDFFSYENLKKLLEDLIPDPNELLKAVYNQLFKCADSPAGKKADLSGKSDTNQKALNTPGGLPAAAAASNVIYASTHASANNFGIK